MLASYRDSRHRKILLLMGYYAYSIAAFALRLRCIIAPAVAIYSLSSVRFH